MTKKNWIEMVNDMLDECVLTDETKKDLAGAFQAVWNICTHISRLNSRPGGTTNRRLMYEELSKDLDDIIIQLSSIAASDKIVALTDRRTGKTTITTAELPIGDHVRLLLEGRLKSKEF